VSGEDGLRALQTAIDIGEHFKTPAAKN